MNHRRCGFATVASTRRDVTVIEQWCIPMPRVVPEFHRHCTAILNRCHKKTDHAFMQNESYLKRLLRREKRYLGGGGFSGE